VGTKNTSSNIGVRAQLGRFPVENFINSQAILYLARLHTDNLKPLLKEAFELTQWPKEKVLHRKQKIVMFLLFH
jgi:hypothetical protein